MFFDVQTWLLVFVRSLSFISLVPLFSAANFPVRLRLGLGAVLAFCLSPGLPPFPLHDLSWFALVGLIAKEVGVGLVLGFITRMVFFVTDLAGSFIATEMGMNLSVSFNPFSALQSQVPGTVLFYLAALLMFTSDLHHWFLAAFYRSYEVLPMNTVGLNPSLLTEVVRHTGSIFRVGLLVAAPMVAVSFVITLVFAVLSRAVPQMNVFTENFAFRTLAGLAVFGMSMQLIGQHLLNYMQRLPDDVLRVAQLLGKG